MKEILKRHLFDILLGLFVILISIGIMLSLFLFKNKDNMKAVIYYHNEFYDEIDLTNVSETKEKEYNFDGKIVVIEYAHQKIRVKDASCHDHTCVKMGWTDSSSKPLVCMDIGYVIKIETGTNDIDVVVG